MKKGLINAFLLSLSITAIFSSCAATFTCPILKANEIYYYYDWIDDSGNKQGYGEWNKQLWRLWINGDSYLTPENQEVNSTPLGAHYFATTDTWYLKCVTGDLSVGPRNNVWPYKNCSISADNTGFDCN